MTKLFNKVRFFKVLSILFFIAAHIKTTAIIWAANVGEYQPLAPIQGFIDQSAVQQSTTQSLGFYVNELFRVGIAAAGFLAVIMIIYGGIQYVGSDVVSTKSEAKKKIQDAILGLLLALSSYLILKTINQDFLATDLRIEKVTTEVIAEPGAAIIPPSNGEPVLQRDKDGNIIQIGTSGRNYLTGNGNIVAMTQAGFRLKDEELNNYILQQINSSGLLNLNPQDAAKYFPNGVTAEGYLSLISSIIQKESGQNPRDVFYENSLGYNSVGLFSLSARDSVVRNLGWSENDLLDPYKNIYAGIQILRNQIQGGGCISCQNSNGRWIGGTAYWSVLRPGRGG